MMYFMGEIEDNVSDAEFFIGNLFKKPYGVRTWNSIKPKLFTKKNITIRLGGLAATTLAGYTGSKLYNKYQESRKKWWEL